MDVPHSDPEPTTADVRAARPAVAVLPIGSFEQHGPFLPLVTDTVVACAIARGLAGAYPVLELPPVTISCSHEHEHPDWPGTVSISAATLAAVVRDVAASLRRAGIGGLALVSGHGGNYVLQNVVQESGAGGDGPRMALFPSPDEWEAVRATAGLATRADRDMHAGELETSVLLHTRPDLVRPGYATSDHVAADRRHLLTTGLRAYTESGVVGLPSLATAAKGRAVLDGLVDAFGSHFSLLAPDA